MVRVLFANELDFPKILVPRLPKNASNVNIESTRKFLFLMITLKQRRI